MASEKYTMVENEFEDLLKEFDDVLEDFETHTPKRNYYQHLKQAKIYSATSMGDSAFESVDSGNSSPDSSLNNSEENLTIVEMMTPSKAKLGDTSDLESYIENLDRVLAEM
ncbi:regulator of cell cycle RGCC-like [Polyodon spathula]|uniref:regulator of cell cycle RGCC-like n=1 Tax=Polyodon spathula TaxID=7913 RepID=UPI001B7DE550|nr:regulator of cell cycle RGCC-like [Polyodon spathula]